MAITYDEMLRMAKRYAPVNVIEDFGPQICNMVTQEIWEKYDWREVTKTLPPFSLIPNEQDYGAPFVSVPSDFYGLRKVNYVNLQGQPPIRIELKVVKDLQLTNVRYMPRSICYNPDTESFRVFPRVPPNVGSPYWMIDGTYKKLPTEITTSNLTNDLPIAPMYFQMWLSGFKWAVKYFMDDPSASQVQLQNGNKTTGGRLAEFHAAMDDAAASEGLELGDYYIAPSEPLTYGTFPMSGGPYGYGTWVY